MFLYLHRRLIATRRKGLSSAKERQAGWHSENYRSCSDRPSRNAAKALLLCTEYGWKSVGLPPSWETFSFSIVDACGTRASYTARTNDTTTFVMLRDPRVPSPVREILTLEHDRTNSEMLIRTLPPRCANRITVFLCAVQPARSAGNILDFFFQLRKLVLSKTAGMFVPRSEIFDY